MSALPHSGYNPTDYGGDIAIAETVIAPPVTAGTLMNGASAVRVYLQALGAFVKALLNELSDQTAYQRHLTAHGATHSPAEWRNFCDEHWRKQSRRGRCC